MDERPCDYTMRDLDDVALMFMGVCVVAYLLWLVFGR